MQDLRIGPKAGWNEADVEGDVEHARVDVAAGK